MYGSLEGYAIERTQLKNSLNCLKVANTSRAVLHYELMNSPELSKNKKGYISEYMREIRYWIFLGYQVVLRELQKQSKESKNTATLELDVYDVAQLIHGLYSFSKNSRSEKLLAKLDELQCLLEEEENENS